MNYVSISWEEGRRCRELAADCIVYPLGIGALRSSLTASLARGKSCASGEPGTLAGLPALGLEKCQGFLIVSGPEP
jgi:hypothetical protein